jgi:hypothetical protein
MIAWQQGLLGRSSVRNPFSFQRILVHKHVWAVVAALALAAKRLALES